MTRFSSMYDCERVKFKMAKIISVHATLNKKKIGHITRQVFIGTQGILVNHVINAENTVTKEFPCVKFMHTTLSTYHSQIRYVLFS